MHGRFVREMPEKVDRAKSWEWMSRSDLKVGTEALLCAAQEQAIRTNYVKHYIDKSSDSPLCGKRGESIQHIVSECVKWQRKYTWIFVGSMGWSMQISGTNTLQRVLLRTRP